MNEEDKFKAAERNTYFYQFGREVLAAASPSWLPGALERIDKALRRISRGRQ